MPTLPAMQGLLNNTPAQKFETALEAESEVDGKLICNGPTSISGVVSGILIAKDLLVIEKTARIRAEIIGEAIIIHGRVEGTISANKSVILTHTANVIGTLRTPTMQIEEGARFDGESQMESNVREAEFGRDKEVPSPVHKLQHDLEAFIA